MIQTLSRNWWLLAISGVLNAAISAIYLIMQRTNGPVVSHTWNGTVILVGKLAMVAGACLLAAAIWRSRGVATWALALNGLALAALGFVQYGLTRYPIGIFVIAALISVMATSFGFAEIAIGRTMSSEGHRADGRFFTAAGVVSALVVLPSLAFGLRWIPMPPGSRVDLLWLGGSFALAAASLIALAVRLPVATGLSARSA